MSKLFLSGSLNLSIPTFPSSLSDSNILTLIPMSRNHRLTFHRIYKSCSSISRITCKLISILKVWSRFCLNVAVMIKAGDGGSVDGGFLVTKGEGCRHVMMIVMDFLFSDSSRINSIFCMMKTIEKRDYDSA
ncbi:unnamed protein product [Lactuca saligna]|uniref:Uncharacterized protein n=1 Tax=Lactuca saligna TaxID=75948 RepID=A0AA35VJF2_LACSI|nr:unnamed protein product [Lactuca saligna]